MNNQTLSIVGASALVVATALFTNPGMASQANPPGPAIITVSKGSVANAIRLGGSVVPDQIVNLTAQMPGDVSFVAGSEGDAFKEGDRLIELDKSSLEAKRQQVLSQLSSAEAGYRNALVQYNHERVNPQSQSKSGMGGMPGMFSMFTDPARSMMGQGNPGLERQTTLYSQGTQVQTARNGVIQAQAALREIDESLKNAVSYAPFDGVIIKRMVEKGDIVQPGMPLVSFADVTKLQIHVDVPTRLLAVVNSEQVIDAYLDGSSEKIPVTVNRIFPMADAGGHTTTVKFDLPPGTRAHSGMYAEIALLDPDSDGPALPVVPKSAVVWHGSLPAVYKVMDNGEIKLRLIRVDDISNQVLTVISGVQLGDRILADPATRHNSQN
jgi:multidrug efflux pump subunit AcrA (membrane-fusion protein)